MRKLLLISTIFIGCSILSCTETSNDLMNEETIITKSVENYADTTKTDSTKTNVNVAINNWSDTISSKHEF